MKKLLLALVAVVLVGGAGLFVWARTVLTGDTVRTTLAAKLSDRLGQPVTIGGIDASIFPRISLNLNQVSIGTSGKVTVGTLAVGTDFRALLSRRIEHATVRLDAAHLTLPLPTLPVAAASNATATPPTSGSGSGVELVSIDEIVLNDVEITSGGRQVRADIDLGINGATATVRKIALRAAGTAVTITGNLTDYAAPAGTLTLQASAMNVLDLVAFVTDFTKGAGLTTTTAATPASAPTSARPAGHMNVAVKIAADRATIGDLVLDKLEGQAMITDAAITVDPARFTVFGGNYTGSCRLRLATRRSSSWPRRSPTSTWPRS